MGDDDELTCLADALFRRVQADFLAATARDPLYAGYFSASWRDLGECTVLAHHLATRLRDRARAGDPRPPKPRPH